MTIYLRTAAMENSFHSMTVVLDIFEKRDKLHQIFWNLGENMSSYYLKLKNNNK